VSAILLVFFIIAKLLGFRLDDIQDDSILRRSVPTAHSIYGVSRTVNSANYAAFVTFEKVLDIGDPKV
jgi:geranylgeranyl diphosphate synthase type 3